MQVHIQGKATVFLSGEELREISLETADGMTAAQLKQVEGEVTRLALERLGIFANAARVVRTVIKRGVERGAVVHFRFQ